MTCLYSIQPAIPQDLRCDLSGELMSTPVRFKPCNHHFEKLILSSWKRGNPLTICPFCRKKFTKLTIDKALLDKIEHYRQQRIQSLLLQPLGKETIGTMLCKWIHSTCHITDYNEIFALFAEAKWASIIQCIRKHKKKYPACQRIRSIESALLFAEQKLQKMNRPRWTKKAITHS